MIDLNPEQDPLVAAIQQSRPIETIGKVVEAYGTLVKVTGISARIGDLCLLKDTQSDYTLYAEAIGVSGNNTLVSPLGPLEGVSSTMEVTIANSASNLPVGISLLGRVIDANGKAIDGMPQPLCQHTTAIYQSSPDPMKRLPIDKPLITGIRAIDGLLTLGLGQRLGIFATAGVGKSTLLGMLAKNTEADINVIILVGERGREVNEFIADNLGPSGLKKSIIIVATSDRPAMERARAAYAGHAIAEHFRNQGKRVLLLMDSITRYTRALRDIGLALGEPPARRGYPPSVFSTLPKLLERTGNNAHGTITAIYTVLVEDEDEADPISEEVRSLLDGHIVMSRQLAASAHFPAIDILASTSRTMNRTVDTEHRDAALEVRRRLAKYRDLELLLQLGEYEAGRDLDSDQTIASHQSIRELLQQDTDTVTSLEQTLTQLNNCTQ
ncbi:MAG: FliI/YscN family ATPase [Pseudomonadales bacterium]|nr:FliI/YscN family ATPase [Pseudomonadales bacterium]